jgi:SpoVK/Ycf46/Vps4 family AAA+-type ATPase
LLSAPTIQIVKEFVKTAMLDSETEERNHISIWSVFSYETGCYRRKIGSRVKRSIDTIYLNDDIKTDLLGDIDKFLNSSEIYDQHGIPYKRNYLLEGVPGTGKSSLVCAIASKLDYDVAIIKLDSPDIKLEHVLHEVPDKCILLIEDIQHCFPTYGGFDMGVSIDAILNILDGIYHKRGLITFMTLNPNLGVEFPENLLRAGRVDRRIFIDPPNEQLIKRIFKSFCPKGNADKFYKSIQHVEGIITPAILQNFLFNNTHPTEVELLQQMVNDNDPSQKPKKGKGKKRKLENDFMNN